MSECTSYAPKWTGYALNMHMHIRAYPYMSTWMCILIITHHAQIRMKHEGWLLHERITPDTYKDGYLKRSNFQIWVHAYLGSYLDFKMYLGNTGPFPSCQLHIANAPLPNCEEHFTLWTAPMRFQLPTN